MSSWYKEAFGEEVTRERPAFLTLRPGESVTVDFLERTCRIIRTSRGPRAVINVRLVDSKKKSDVRTLVLGHKVLARKIAMLELEYDGLNGLTVRIANKGKTERGYYDYDVELLKLEKLSRKAWRKSSRRS